MGNETGISFMDTLSKTNFLAIKFTPNKGIITLGQTLFVP